LDEGLQDLQHFDHHLLVARVQCRLDRDDELRDDWQDLGATVLEHVQRAFLCEEGVGHLGLSGAVEEDGQVVVEVELLDVDLPLDLVLNTAMVDLDRQVAAVVEASEFCVRRVGALCRCGGFLFCLLCHIPHRRDDLLHLALLNALPHTRPTLPGAARQELLRVRFRSVLAVGESTSVHSILVQCVHARHRNTGRKNGGVAVVLALAGCCRL